MSDLEALIAELGIPEYTREQFEQDRARLLDVISTKHGIPVTEVPALIRAHAYEHSFDDPEDEYIQIMAFARAAGWLSK